MKKSLVSQMTSPGFCMYYYSNACMHAAYAWEVNIVHAWCASVDSDSSSHSIRCWYSLRYHLRNALLYI